MHPFSVIEQIVALPFLSVFPLQTKAESPYKKIMFPLIALDNLRIIIKKNAGESSLIHEIISR